MENQSYPPFSIIHQRTDERNISRYPSGSYQGATEEHRPDIGGFPSFLSFQSTTNPAGPLELVKLATHIHPTEPLAAAAAHHGTMAIPNPAGQIEGALAAPKYGTLIPNRVFVGGISGDTTEAELCRLFSSYGNVKSTKIIVDRAGVSKGYGFVTFETEHEAQRLQSDGDCIVLRDRKLNIAPAIKKQTICATNGAVYYAATPPTPTINNIPIEQFATVYPPGVPTIYPPTMPYQPFYQYYSVPMNVPTIWPQNYQGIYPC